jgi:hypothetical protein
MCARECLYICAGVSVCIYMCVRVSVSVNSGLVPLVTLTRPRDGRVPVLKTKLRCHRLSFKSKIVSLLIVATESHLFCQILSTMSSLYNLSHYSQ